MNRPERRNALSLAMMTELIAALRELSAQPQTRAIILAGNGPAFSAGHDLREMTGRDITAYRHIFDVCTQLMSTVQEIPQPVIARVHAIATAAGCQLVATCDLAIAADTAKFATPGREDRPLLHDADGGADPRRRPQARPGDAAHRRRDRRADGDGVGPGQPRRARRASSTKRRSCSPSRSPKPARSPSPSASRRSTRRSISTSRRPTPTPRKS